MSTRSKRSSSGYRCTECGWSTVKWVGRCAECQAWGTMEEVGEHKARTTPARSIADPAKPIAQVDATQATSVPTGVGELDRVLGGGLVPGAVILLAREPGVGKSTLLLDVAARVAQGTAPRGPRSVLYITGCLLYTSPSPRDS